MNAFAASQQAARAFRNRLLWEEEARAICTNTQALSPAARDAVCAVLEAILDESEDGEIAASACSLLAALERLGEAADAAPDPRIPR